MNKTIKIHLSDKPPFHHGLSAILLIFNRIDTIRCFFNIAERFPDFPDAFSIPVCLRHLKNGKKIIQFDPTG